MEGDDGSRYRKSMVWGLFLIVLGAAFLLERFGLVDIPIVGRLWPVVFFVIGLAHLLDRKPGAALGMFMMGGIFLAVTFDWMGLTWSNFWPLMLVAAGVSMIAKTLTGEDRRRKHGGVS